VGRFESRRTNRRWVSTGSKGRAEAMGAKVGSPKGQ
jgi:hypothetical protein